MPFRQGNQASENIGHVGDGIEVVGWRYCWRAGWARAGEATLRGEVLMDRLEVLRF